MSNLFNLKIRVYPVVGARLSSGLYQAHFFIIPDGLLGEIHHPGYITYRVSVIIPVVMS